MSLLAMEAQGGEESRRAANKFMKENGDVDTDNDL